VVERRADPAEASLVEAAASGDVDALARIMALHDGSMRRICMVITGDAGLVDDAVQAAWVAAWRRLRTLRDPARLRPWLMSVAANEARQASRSASRRVARERRAEPSPVLSDPAMEGDLLDLADAVSRLEPDERRLLALRYVADLTSDDIAREVGGSASSVRGRLARIIRRLRTELLR
jgi:RNA polymerase sigma-70 factor (ECF subfamily)